MNDINLELYYSSDDSDDFSSSSSNARFSYVFDSINIENKSVLDFGCGTGKLYEWLHNNNKKHKSYVGFDIRLNTLRYAQQKNAHDSAIAAEFTNKFPTEKFDVIVLFGTVSYAFNENIDICKKYYEKEIKKLFTLLNNDGKLFLTLRKAGKELSKDHKKMITYTHEEITSISPKFVIEDLFEHEYIVTYFKS